MSGGEGVCYAAALCSECSHLIRSDARQALLRQLPLKHLLLDRARAEHAVKVAPLLLPVAPDSRGRLLVVRGVPIGVEEDETVAADEVEAAPARFGREEEAVEAAVWVVEVLDHLRTLRTKGGERGGGGGGGGGGGEWWGSCAVCLVCWWW